MTKRLELPNRLIHIQMYLTLNDSSYNWHDPSVQTEFNMTVPVDMFNSTNFTKVIDKKMKELESHFGEAVAEYEAKLAEEEKAKQLENKEA